MNTLKKAINILSLRERKLGLFVLLLVMGMALLETVGVASVMPFLAVLGNPDMLNTNPILKNSFIFTQNFGIRTIDQFLIFLGFSSFFLIIISTVYRIITHYIMNRFIEMRRHSIGIRLLSNYLHQPYTFFLKRHTSELSKIILSEVDQLIGNVLRPIYSMFTSSLVLVAITILLLLVNFWLAVSAVCILGTLYALVFLILKHRLKIMGTSLVDANKKRFISTTEVFGGIKDIKLLGKERIYQDRFSEPSKKFAETHANSHTLNQIPNFLIEAIIFGALLLLTLLLMISSNGLNNNLLGKILPIIGLYAFAAYRMKPAIHHIYEGFASLKYGHAIVNNISADLSLNKSPSLQPQNIFTSIKAKHKITLDELNYIYPNAKKVALNNLNLEIPVYSSIGLVGTTGAGKTTLVNIILGLLRPNSGVIKVDGIPITGNKIRAWQASLGYVPQDIFLTDNSVSENIAFGVPLEQINQKHVIKCARMAQVHDFIMKDMPAQYQTFVGERGVRLSGGQRQRIGIARALYHNPEVIVFDEATSALDKITEQAVMNSIDSIAKHKTIIIIAHRISTVKNCDQIVLLDKGKIKAIGLYSQLIGKIPQFQKMAE